MDMSAGDRDARFAEAVNKLISAFAEIGDLIAKMMERMFDVLNTMREALEDFEDVDNGEGEPIYNTISGATKGDIRVSTYTRGADRGSGRDVKHRETLCVIVNHSETN